MARLIMTGTMCSSSGFGSLLDLHTKLPHLKGYYKIYFWESILSLYTFNSKLFYSIVY